MIRPKFRAAAAGAALEKIYDVYMTPDGHLAAGKQEDDAISGKPRNPMDEANQEDWSRRGETSLLPKK